MIRSNVSYTVTVEEPHSDIFIRLFSLCDKSFHLNLTLCGADLSFHFISSSDSLPLTRLQTIPTILINQHGEVILRKVMG